MALLGEQATAADLVDLAELMIIAAGGYVSPEAEAELARALALDPEHPVGALLFRARRCCRRGRPDLAFRIWSRLLAEGPADAPWIEPASPAQIDAVARAGLAPPAAAPGPTRRGRGCGGAWRRRTRRR